MLDLVKHPASPPGPITAIRVEAGRGRGQQLSLRFHVEGATDGVIWPEPGDRGGRQDGLWRHSCFEAFVRPAGQDGYCEINLATSGAWAAYWFDAYRDGMRDLEAASRVGSFDMPVSYFHKVVRMPDLDDVTEWRIGLSAVIEAKDGSKFYWALRHPPGPPDFHHPDCFAAILEAPAPDVVRYRPPARRP